MSANFNLEEATHKYNMKVMDLDAELRKMKLEAGCIGRVFGIGVNAPVNVAALTLTIVLAVGVIALCFRNNTTEVWKIIAPIITLVVGFVFGKNSERH